MLTYFKILKNFNKWSFPTSFQIPHLLHKLKAVGKVSKARHNPYAWRLVKKVEGIGGEGGAATESREFDQHDCGIKLILKKLINS
jgi:hypothetical protein